MSNRSVAPSPLATLFDSRDEFELRERILEICSPQLRRAEDGVATYLCFSEETRQARRGASHETKQRARQSALASSREFDAVSWVIAREQGLIVLYEATMRDAGGWRAIRGGLERPLDARPLDQRYLLKPGSKLRLSTLAQS